MESKVVAGPQGNIALYSGGNSDVSAPALLFVHSDAGRASQWSKLWDQLGKRYRLVALDLRGHGRSDPARDGDYGYVARAADIAAAAKSAGLLRFVIVAHSAGAGSSLRFAADHPDQVGGLFLIDPASDPAAIPPGQRKQMVDDLSGPDGAKALHDYQAGIAGKDPKVLSEVAAANSLLGQAARAGIAKALADWDPRAALDAAHVPIEIVISDRADGPGSIYRLKAGIRHHVVKGTGHWIALEKPGEMATLVDTFAQRVEAK